MDYCTHFGNCCVECLKLLLKKTTSWLHNVMSVTARISKLAELMVFEVLANLWMPLCADFQVAVVHLADFFHMLLSATFTKLTKASLIMSANCWAIMHGQSHSDISEVTGVGSGLHLQIYFRFFFLKYAEAFTQQQISFRSANKCRQADQKKPRNITRYCRIAGCKHLIPILETYYLMASCFGVATSCNQLLTCLIKCKQLFFLDAIASPSSYPCQWVSD